LVTNSEAFNLGLWNLARTSAFGSGSIANSTTAPNGTLTADYIQQASGQTGSGGAFIFLPYTAGQSYTLSVYAKKAENNYLRLGFATGTGGTILFGNFDLNTGVPGTPDAGITQTIESVGDGWYRCTATTTSQITTSAGTTFIYQSSTFNSVVTTPLQGIFIWGAQLVEGTDAKPYFATTNRQDVPRLDYRNADGTVSTCPRLLLEPQRTNSIRNSTMVGAVAGSPGTLPTNWNQSGGGGLTTTISLGTENGLSYVDIRYNGTATQSFLELRFEGTTAIAALTAQTWTASAYLKAISGTIPTSQLTIIERTAAGGFITQGSTLSTPTSTLQRFTLTRTLSGGATVAFVQPLILFTLTIGAAYDFTIRIAAPQMELGAYATTFIPTTTAAVTRLADTASKTGVSSLIGQTEGTIYLEADIQKYNESGFYIAISAGAELGNAIYVQQPTSGNLQILIRKTGNANSTVSILNANWTAGVNKVAIAYTATTAEVFINGVSKGTTSFISAPACSQITIGSRPDNPGQLVGAGNYNQAALFPTRLTNDRLAEITTL
jgi:hypothetical protein